MDGHVESSSVHRIEFPVDWPPGHVAAYLLDCGGRLTLVDAGMPGADTASVLTDSFAERGYAVEDVDDLVVTHPHVDHVGQVGTVVEAADPTVHAPAGIRERFARDPDDLEATVRETATAAGIDGADREELVSMAVESLRRDRDLLSPEAVDHWVGPTERFEIGTRAVEAVHAPGHQADQLCYHLPDEGVLLSGDAAVEPFRPVALHAGLDRGVADAIEAYYAALDRLAALASTSPPGLVLPGHGPTHDDLDGVVERDRASLDRMLDRTVEAVERAGGTATARSLAEERAGDDDVRYVVAEVVGALSHLESTDRVAWNEVDGVRHYRLAGDAA